MRVAAAKLLATIAKWPIKHGASDQSRLLPHRDVLESLVSSCLTSKAASAKHGQASARRMVMRKLRDEIQDMGTVDQDRYCLAPTDSKMEIFKRHQRDFLCYECFFWVEFDPVVPTLPKIWSCRSQIEIKSETAVPNSKYLILSFQILNIWSCRSQSEIRSETIVPNSKYLILSFPNWN